LVFCKFGGRLGTTLYIHFTRRWVEARRHSSARREKKNEKKAEKNAVLRSAGFEVGEGVRVEGELAEVLRGTERRHAGG
jgi:hypothetical protein